MTAVPTTHVAGRQLDLHWRTRTVAAVLMGISAMGVWSGVFGAGVLWAAPVLVWAVLLTTRLVAPTSRWQTLAVGGSWLIWVPLAALLVGMPTGILDPTSARSTLQNLVDGLRNGLAGTPGVWSLAAWLAIVGMCWVRGAANAVKPGNGAAAWGFIYFATPFAGALALGRADDAAWHGAALLAGALLWATAGGLRSAAPAVAVVAVVATIVGSLIGPTERKLRFAGERPNNGQVSWDLNYGPDNSSQAGAVLLDVQSQEPRLWRARVLEHFDGRSFQANVHDPSEDLPQPAARLATTTVTVRKLDDVQAVGPGRIIGVTGGQVAQRVPLGESWAFTRSPEQNSRYTVTSQVVQPDAAQLASVKIPSPRAYPEQIALWDNIDQGMGQPLARHLADMPSALAGSQLAQVLETARSLSEGTHSQLEVVRRVQDYLLDPNRFRYSRSDAAPVDRQPLLTFLTRTHVGYCQHFAASAALLLRMAGVPTRVVAGFATGSAMGSDRYRVTDEDPHAWIEVYFQGIGWVPFNPTPGTGAAHIGKNIDPLAVDDRENRAISHGSRQLGIVVLGLVALGTVVMIVRRLRRRTGSHEPLGDVLVRLVPGAPRPSTTVAAIGPELARIGPSVAALASVAQRERFAPGGGAGVDRPRRMVWRALRSDVGVLRAARLMILGPPRIEGDAAHVMGVGTPEPPMAARTLGNDGSVAPPGR